ncbi:cobalamin biosynthesis protein CobD [Heliobacterium gestii]|uniref:Cobalamin biosynthesis protein CobD n=1 Tax=Heliomicrobium gestii TaxID=2699 RepID=A0A845LLN1_HELGE|nr:adenosylcobinamide-phosphate synthase CbiB [Heliomicrobium gestii]MBM7867211.1 adenosylcobinamide-phosphate synthase [Heliomicrobium gestii]MZP43766.1 cobalamin biosynthesis protein CobD [Heliomicrobium gestii]
MNTSLPFSLKELLLVLDASLSIGAVTLLSALLYDSLVGDPRWLPHPVIGIGKLITSLEKKLYPTAGAADKHLTTFFRGMALSVTTVAVTFFITTLLMAAIELAGFGTASRSGFGTTFGSLGLNALNWKTLLGKVATVILLGIAFAGRCLAEAALEIKGLLERGDMVEARRKLSWIVGRDTDNLDESEIVRATVETVAENTVDGITSPLFYALLFGVPGAYAYKAVNTLDSMIGYRNDRYLWFGRFAARLDDVANYIPARLTGLSMILAATLLGYPFKRMVYTWRIDARRHPSPNSGIPESVMAGALGVQLGGLNYYQGRPSHRATMGQPHVRLEARHIGQTVRVMAATTAVFALAGSVILYGLGKWL